MGVTGLTLSHPVAGHSREAALVVPHGTGCGITRVEPPCVKHDRDGKGEERADHPGRANHAAGYQESGAGSHDCQPELTETHVVPLVCGERGSTRGEATMIFVEDGVRR